MSPQQFQIVRDSKVMTHDDWSSLRHEAEQLFTPGTAIKEQELFAGRQEQITKLAQRIRLSGGHAVIYGERGVGKSSLVNIFRYVADASPSRVQYIRVAATDGDDYNALFVKIFKRMTLEEGERRTRLSDLYEGKQITPDDVLLEFENFSSATVPIIVIDEFDRLKDHQAKTLVSDTVKLISDEAINATFFIVGVSDAVEELLHGHESIGRALSQVEMPRMSDSEIIDIINRRLKRAGIKITSDAIWDCVFICKGLPHYAHLLGLHAMQSVCDRKALIIERRDIEEASRRALADSNQSIKSGFENAIFSERPDNIFKQVLIACALVQKDSFGRFTAKSVATILSEITGERYDVPAFSYHLKEFCDTARGPILKKMGQTRRFTFRFLEALMESYVILEGMNQKIITNRIVERNRPKRQPDLFSAIVS
jgi:Cdc6-like AAA superfamily ATPase